MPFPGTSFLAIARGIMDETPAPLPSQYTKDMTLLVSQLLSKEEKNRPSILQILKMPFVQTHIECIINVTASANIPSTSVGSFENEPVRVRRMDLYTPSYKEDSSVQKKENGMENGCVGPVIDIPLPPSAPQQRMGEDAKRQLPPGPPASIQNEIVRHYLQNKEDAKRNRERVRVLDAQPACFLNVEETPVPTVAAPVRKNKVVVIKQNDTAREVYLENRRAARANMAKVYAQLGRHMPVHMAS